MRLILTETTSSIYHCLITTSLKSKVWNLVPVSQHHHSSLRSKTLVIVSQLLLSTCAICSYLQDGNPTRSLRAWKFLTWATMRSQSLRFSTLMMAWGNAGINYLRPYKNSTSEVSTRTWLITLRIWDFRFSYTNSLSVASAWVFPWPLYIFGTPPLPLAISPSTLDYVPGFYLFYSENPCKSRKNGKILQVVCRSPWENDLLGAIYKRGS